MILDRAHTELGWPAPPVLFEPEAPAARVAVSEAQTKIERALRLLPSAPPVRVGVVLASSEDTEAPLAVVCDFDGPAPEHVLLEAHRLAWNYSRTNLLVTAEPGGVRAWTCSEPPAVDRDGERLPGAPKNPLRALVVAEADGSDGTWVDGSAAALHWAELVTGRLFRQNAGRFRENRRAHVTLLQNLRAVRKRLRDMGLADRHTHDLLARLIFVQFLFDRKDPKGYAALDAERLRGYYAVGDMEHEHQTLADVLRAPEDTYALFERLDAVFHGDLFDPSERERERAAVGANHLALLAHFVQGDAEFGSGQLSLWRTYSFDVIPLDLLSSVYETFVDKDSGVGVHYTPTHVADFVLDRVLPWDSDEWDVRVLDPACGSGIFLVKAFQRLVHRWRRAHPEQGAPRIPVLRRLLEDNLVGVDLDGEAVRVAAFSLYLAMCDEIEPRHVWNEQGLFPRLRGRTLCPGDFFDDTIEGVESGIRVAGTWTGANAGRYDLVVGNPPFGRGTVTDAATGWADRTGWPVANGDVGTLFVAKAGALVREDGAIAMVQSAPALLYNTTGPALEVRRRVFLEAFRVEGVTVLPPRFRLFKNVKMPACVVVLRNAPADGSPFAYECLKRQWTARVELDDKIRFVHDPEGVHWLRPQEVVDEPWVWAALAWGGPRDRALVRRLRQFSSLHRLAVEGAVRVRRGVERGNRKKEQAELIGRRYLSGPDLPPGSRLVLDGATLPRTDDPLIGEKVSTDLSAFELPQLLVKMSWVQSAAGFQARRVVGEPVVAEKTFLSASGPEEVLDAASVAYNSDVATYFLLLTSGRLAFDRSEPLVRDLLSVPLPPANSVDLSSLRSDEDVQAHAFDLFDLTEAERVLVEDLVAYTLDDFKGVKGHQPGRLPTERAGGEEPHLDAYGDSFGRVIAAAYGDEGQVQMHVLAEDGPVLPVRLVRFVVGPAVEPGRATDYVPSSELRNRLAEAYQQAREARTAPFRVARAYETVDVAGTAHLAVTLIKPDEVRYWTRSAGIRDADRFAADVALWAAGRLAGGVESVAVDG